ncbi:response regulator [Massilia sp. DWR3-1-1]|uniref:response regulator n=1 Tax=Massilia sp. DWR3-1-1 TaxID=2804559 RepID=UPI003CED8E28
MHSPSHPHAVRLIGFAPDDSAGLGATLLQSSAAGPHYYCLLDDSLQEPDLYVVKGDDGAALGLLAGLNPGEATPVLLLGPATPRLPFARLDWPADPLRLHQALAELVARRAQALAQMAARGQSPVRIERRRTPRIDIDLSEGAAGADHQYVNRRQSPPSGAILIVDKGGAFRDHVAKVVGTRRLPVEWTDSAGAAVRLCDETAVSLLMINTSTPRIDPYRLCADVKGLPGAARTAVVFLLARNYPYDAGRARAAGVRGVLDKPVADRHLYSAITKLMSLP